jgi:hypothetical protein
MKKFSRLTLCLCFLAVITVLSGCATTTPNPASPPSPPLEVPLPIVLKFVEFDALTTDLNTLTGASSPSLVASKVVNPGENVAELIESTALLVQMFENEILIPVTKGIGDLEIPVDENIQAFEGEVTLTMYSDFFLSSLLGRHEVKLDFRDYDFDGNGVAEGCSGHTAELPICVRFWLDDKRFIAWVFESYPVTEDDPGTIQDDRTVGKGKYKVFLENVSGVTWEIATSYEQTIGDAEGKAYDTYLKGTTIDHFTFFAYVSDEGQEIQATRQHLRISREGPEETALKSIDMNQSFDVPVQQGAVETVRSKDAQRFREGSDRWAGSIFRESLSQGVISVNTAEQDICAQISTKLAVELGQCDDVNGESIRIGFDPLFPEDGHPFINGVTDADVALPADFSAAPPLDFPSLPKPL